MFEHILMYHIVYAFRNCNLLILSDPPPPSIADIFILKTKILGYRGHWIFVGALASSPPPLTTTLASCFLPLDKTEYHPGIHHGRSMNQFPWIRQRNRWSWPFASGISCRPRMFDMLKKCKLKILWILFVLLKNKIQNKKCLAIAIHTKCRLIFVFSLYSFYYVM